MNTSEENLFIPVDDDKKYPCPGIIYLITLFLISVGLNKITEEVLKLKLNQSFMVCNKNGKM